MRPLLFLCSLLSTCIIHTNGFSVCNDINLNFVISSDLLTLTAIKVSEFINHIIDFASSEEAGFSIIFYGDIPETYINQNNEILLALKDTYSQHDRQVLKTTVTTALQQFQDDLLAPNAITIPYTRAEALTAISTQEKPTRTHYTKTKIGSSAGADDDNDFYFIFDENFGMENTNLDTYYISDQQFESTAQSEQEETNDQGAEPENYETITTVDDSTCLEDISTKVNPVCGLLNTYSSSTSSINFVSYQQFTPDDNYPYYKSIRCLDYDTENGHPNQRLEFISLALFNNPEELDIIYQSSCPNNYSIESLGDVSFVKTTQWMDEDTVIECDLTYITLQEYQTQNNIPATEHDPKSTSVLDPQTSFIYVKDINGDENTFHEQAGLIANEQIFNALPESCAAILMRIETIEDVDLNAQNLPTVIADAVANDVNFDPLNGDKILKLSVGSFASPEEYIHSSHLNADGASEEEGFEVLTPAIRRRLLLLKDEQDLIRVVRNNGRKLLDYSIDIGLPEIAISDCGRRCVQINLDWEATFSASGGFSHGEDPWEISIEGELTSTLGIWLELQLESWSDSRFYWNQYFPNPSIDAYDIRVGLGGYYEVGFSYDIELEASLTFTVEPLFRYIYDMVIMAGPIPIQIGLGINTDLEISWADPQSVFVFEAGVTCTHRDVFELGFTGRKWRHYSPRYGVLRYDAKVRSGDGRGINLGNRDVGFEITNVRDCADAAYHFGVGLGLDCHIFQYGNDGCFCQKRWIDALGIRGSSSNGNNIYILEHGNCATGSTCNWFGTCWHIGYPFGSFKMWGDGRCGWFNDGQRSKCSYCGNIQTGQGNWRTLIRPSRDVVKDINNEISSCEPIWDFDPAHFCDLSFGVDITLSPSFVIVFYQIVEAGVGLDIISEIRINLPETNPNDAIAGANCNSEYSCTDRQIDGSLSIEIKAQLFYSFTFDITRLLTAICPDCDDITFSANGYEVNTEDAELSYRQNFGPEFELLPRVVLICFPLLPSHVNYIYNYCCDVTREPSPSPTGQPSPSPSKAPTPLNNLVSLRLRIANGGQAASAHDPLYIKISYGDPLQYSPWFHISEDWEPGELRFISEFDQYRNELWTYIYFFDFYNHYAAEGQGDNLKISYIEYRDSTVADGDYIFLGKTDGTSRVILKQENDGCRRMAVPSGGLSNCHFNNPYVNPVSYDPTESPTNYPTTAAPTRLPTESPTWVTDTPTHAPTDYATLTIFTTDKYIKTIKDTIYVRLGFVTDTSYMTDWIKLEGTKLWEKKTEYKARIFDGYDSHTWTHLYFQNINTQLVANGNEIFEISGIQYMDVNNQYKTIGDYKGEIWLTLDSNNNGCKGIDLSSKEQVDCPDCSEQFYDVY